MNLRSRDELSGLAGRNDGLGNNLDQLGQLEVAYIQLGCYSLTACLPCGSALRAWRDIKAPIPAGHFDGEDRTPPAEVGADYVE